MRACVIAADSFKGSCSALEVCRALRDGMRRVYPHAEYRLLPAADGGEGTVTSLVDSLEGRLERCWVTGPLGDPVEASFAVLPGQRAVLEMAAASGLTLVPQERRNPSKTTTYGTGELIRAALDAGCRELLIGIGGSATNDCGVGMAQALGIACLDSSGNELPYGGGELGNLNSIDTSGRDPRLDETTISVACDVDNPLCGPRGASAVYARQKGADSQMVHRLDKALEHCSRIMERDIGCLIADIPGSGAAGGLGGGLVGFLGAKLERGIDAVLSMIRFDDHLKGADLVITGEGNIDS